jgi:hypothetical protein
MKNLRDILPLFENSEDETEHLYYPDLESDHLELKRQDIYRPSKEHILHIHHMELVK